jgi:hypothetical protein
LNKEAAMSVALMLFRSASTINRLPRTRSRIVATGLRLWHDVSQTLFSPYRPELHYMRGPGPKWRDKHAQR